MDSVKINVKAGKGGNGLVSFWHEKFQPFGGPDGGDGGKGGNVYLLADTNTMDLSPFRNTRSYSAGDGYGGGKQKKHGKNGENKVIKVPVGTSVYKVDNVEKEFIADLSGDRQKVIVAEGGKGGLGNVHFATATHQVPRKATPGKEGELVNLLLEYTIPADVVIMGLPNSGKSSLLSKITGVAVKIADYPFTTVETVPGSADINDRLLTFIEIPALIQGSSFGKGLGNRFLRHCSRAQVLIMLLDGSSDNVEEDFSILVDELKTFDEKLVAKYIIAVVNKIDLPEVSDKIHKIHGKLGLKCNKQCLISAANGEGISELLDEVVHCLRRKKEDILQSPEKEVVFKPRPVNRKIKE
jgi:GTP-binding protein